VKTLIYNGLQVDNNSCKSVGLQQFGNALWFTAASSVDDESFDDEENLSLNELKSDMFTGTPCRLSWQS